MSTGPITALIISTLFAAGALAQEVRQAAPPVATGVPRASADPQAWTAAPQANAAELTWLTDLPAAQARAKGEGKSLLLFFHGSDWCPTCAEMKGQVFDSPEFRQYARRALVLVDVDFPEKGNQSDELKRANLALKERFNLTQELGGGFPTIVLLNANGGTVFQETGYAGGGPAEVLPKLKWHTESTATTTDAVGYKNLDVEEFARMAADKQNVILDVRTQTEFKAGHLPGAVNLDVNAADFQEKAALLNKGKTYLVHCASGVRSVKACEKLTRFEFPKLYNLAGGFRAWAQAGKPVEK
jgi:rhodanese-related sulfurtransferase